VYDAGGSIVYCITLSSRFRDCFAGVCFVRSVSPLKLGMGNGWDRHIVHGRFGVHPVIYKCSPLVKFALPCIPSLNN